MCGIAGFVNFDGHDTDAARQSIIPMTDILTHRGPNDSGFYVDNHAALGHRRLSIIDLKSGHQPMSVLSGQLQIVFNGEIYNFLELRKELEKQGFQFKTNSDTEVILCAYQKWGESCVGRLNGMFAMAIWDRRQRTLFLARDRVGKKPLYVLRQGPIVAFASEIKSFRAGGLETGSVDSEALDCYLTLGYVPAPKTIYRNVRKLRPAHSLTVSAGSWTEAQYWDLSFAPQRKISADEALEEFDALLDSAVRCRLISEVPLGAFLSGGLDSSLVVSSMSRQSGGPVKTHTIGFDDNIHNETHVARQIADHLQTEHHEYTIKPDAVDVLEKIAWHFDEPFSDSSALPTWYVCEMTRQSVTVALSGDGGDEGFGGYTFRYLPHAAESRVRRLIPPSIRSAVFGPLGSIWPASSRLPKALRLKSILENLAVGDAQAFYRDLAWLRDDARGLIYRPDFLQNLNGFTPFETVNPYYSGNDASDALGRSQFADIHVYLTDDVLTKVDRMSMAHSLEVRAPLLDHRILEFAARLPAKMKMNMRRGKLPLRALAARRLPAKIESLPKRGFSIPAAQWLREELRPMAEDVVFERNGIVADTLDTKVLRDMWKQHQNKSRDHSVFLWGLMMLGLWEKNENRTSSP